MYKFDALFSLAMLSIASSGLPVAGLNTVIRPELDCVKVKYLHLCHLAKLRAYYDNWVRFVTRYVNLIHIPVVGYKSSENIFSNFPGCIVVCVNI